MSKVTVPSLRGKKDDHERIVMVTAYDYPTARLVDECGIDVVLVGDSLGNVIQGRPNTVGVTMDEMIYHTTLVVRGTSRALVTGDMPFMSYQSGPDEGLRNAARFLKEAGAASVKLEVCEQDLDTVLRMTSAGIPVMGHIGLCPQSINVMGGYKVQGRTKDEAARLLRLAGEIESAGAFSLVLESIPAPLARKITESIKIPTIGIGAGPDCDGQVLVFHDLTGLSEPPYPGFVKKYADLRGEISKALSAFCSDVRNGTFPSGEHSFD